jgi:hypothetical protein
MNRLAYLLGAALLAASAAGTLWLMWHVLTLPTGGNP